VPRNPSGLDTIRVFPEPSKFSARGVNPARSTMTQRIQVTCDQDAGKTADHNLFVNITLKICVNTKAPERLRRVLTDTNQVIYGYEDDQLFR